MARLPIVRSDLDQWGDILNEYLLVAHETDGTQTPFVTDTANWAHFHPAEATITAGSSGPIPLADLAALIDGDASLLDMTDPSAPLLTSTGLWTMAVWPVRNDASPEAAFAYAELFCQGPAPDNRPFMDIGTSFTIDDAAGHHGACTLTGPQSYMEAGTVITCTIWNGGGSDHPFQNAEFWIAKLADGG